MIEVRNLYKTYQSKDIQIEAVNNVSFKVNKGEIYGIIGLSGAGKSTLVRCLNLLERPEKGEIIIDNDNLLSLNDKQLKLKRRKIGMIFQSFNLLMQENVLNNICFPMIIAGMNKSEARLRAIEYLKIVGLQDKAYSYPSQLSGGQKQRVAIARVLASNPEILLCDEATSALDPQTTKSILNLLQDINKEYGITIIIITHEMSVIQEVCHRCAVLENGCLVEENSVEELFKHPKTEAARRLIFNSKHQINDIGKGRVYRIAFEESNTSEPVIANMILEFKVPINILESNISNINGHAKGQMMIELPDNDELVDKMVKYLEDKDCVEVVKVNDYVR